MYSRALPLRTAFRGIVPNLAVGTELIDGRDIISLKIIRKGEDMPVKGMVTSELVARIWFQGELEPNAAVDFSYEDCFGTIRHLAPHFVSRIHREGKIVTIHAFDRMRLTERPFDDSGFDEKKEPFLAESVLMAISSQCGFKAGAGIGSGMTVLYYSDIHGKRIRQILDTLSQHSVGAWYCSDSDQLKFTEFMASSAVIWADREGSSELYIHGRKGPVQAVEVMNTRSGRIFTAGMADGGKGTFRFSGTHFGQAQADTVLARLNEKGGVYRSFSCDHLESVELPEGLSEIRFHGDDPGPFIANRLEIYPCAAGIRMKAGAADVCEDEWEYLDVVGYELKNRIEEEKFYGSVIIGRKGLGILSAEDTDDPWSRESFYFSPARSGAAEFDGAIIDGRMPDRIESISDGVKRIVYGDVSYTLRFDKGADGSKSNIRLTRG